MHAVDPPKSLGGQALVCGGSLAGLLSAALLARHFDQVTLVERDALFDGAQVRKGVPQGAQSHILLKRGLDIATQLFPGLPRDLEAAGAQVLDASSDCAWFTSGIWRRRIACGLPLYSQTRPLFEGVIRARLMALPNVRMLDRHEALGFLSSGGRVTGLRLRARGSGQELELPAEFVVDASGRASRTPRWLEGLGYPRVQETTLEIDVGYATRMYRKPRGAEAAWKLLLVSAELPRLRRCGVILPVEGERWMATLSGWLGELPPTDEQGFLQFAASLAQPDLHEALRGAEPLAPPVSYRFARSQWRHYERLAPAPEGLVVVGDAFCAFNPIYGQGMTTGALLVELLGACLREGLGGLSRRYFERARRILQVPWSLAASEDLRLPEVRGPRPPGSRALQWYRDRVHRLTARDEDLVRTFMQVIHMLKPPSALFAPRLLLKVLTARW